MLLASLFLFLLHAKIVHMEPWCGDGNGTSMSFEQAKDRVAGRYTATFCSELKTNVTKWEVELSVYSSTKCNTQNLRLRRSTRHSLYSEIINSSSIPHNCSNICMSTNFDLIYSACYGIKSIINEGMTDQKSLDSTYIMISNGYDKEFFRNKVSHIAVINYDTDVTLNWYLGIPPTSYEVRMNEVGNISNFEDVTSNCTGRANLVEVKCNLSLKYGCYKLILTNHAPWTHGVFFDKTHVAADFCHRRAEPQPSSGSGLGAGAVALLGCGTLVTLGAAAALARRAWASPASERLRDKLCGLTRSTEPHIVPTVTPSKISKDILLLYARECELGQRAVALLRELLQHITTGRVYDVYAAGTVAAAGAAPHAWVAAVLQRDAAVLLLQSPALLLHRAHLHHHHQHQHRGLALSAPLLGAGGAGAGTGGGVVYRVPQFGDALLQYALRLLPAAREFTPHPYTKFYLATTPGLKEDLYPELVQFSRYEMPGAVRVLLDAISPNMAAELIPTDLVAEFTQAFADFLHYITENPDYLNDEIIYY